MENVDVDIETLDFKYKLGVLLNINLIFIPPKETSKLERAKLKKIEKIIEDDLLKTESRMIKNIVKKIKNLYMVVKLKKI
jgi:hypothetical protein